MLRRWREWWARWRGADEMRPIAPLRHGRQEIERLTSMFREDADAYWADLRRLLRERGATPEHWLLLAHFPDEVTDGLLLLAPDGKPFEAWYASVDREWGTAEPRVDLFSELTADSQFFEFWSNELETRPRRPASSS